MLTMVRREGTPTPSAGASEPTAKSTLPEGFPSTSPSPDTSPVPAPAKQKRTRRAKPVVPLPERFVDAKELEAALKTTRQTIWRNVNKGDFPRPIRIGANRKVWLWSDILAWINERKQHPIAPRVYFGRDKQTVVKTEQTTVKTEKPVKRAGIQVEGNDDGPGGVQSAAYGPAGSHRLPAETVARPRDPHADVARNPAPSRTGRH